MLELAELGARPIEGDALIHQWDSLSISDKMVICDQLRGIVTSLRLVEQNPVRLFRGSGRTCVWNECAEMDDSTYLPILSRLRADTYTQGNSIGRVSHAVATRYAVYSPQSRSQCISL